MRFRNGNKKYLKIKSIAKEIVNGLLTEQELFLDLALKAVIEALRMNSDMYAIIYNSKYDGTQNVFDGSTTTAAAVPYTHISTSTQSQNQHQNRYYNEYREGISEIANSLLKMLLNQMVDNTKVAAVKEKVDVSRFSQEGNQKGTTKTGTCGILS